MTDSSSFIIRNVNDSGTARNDSVQDAETEEPLPRLCHLKLTRDHHGYGFNLKSKQERLCQFIGKVDPNTPAYYAGLKDNDRIVEINCKNVENASHERILEIIKQGIRRNGVYVRDELLLLVLDQKADEYYSTKDTIIKTNGNSVKKIFASSDLNELLLYSRNKENYMKTKRTSNDSSSATISKSSSSHHNSIVIDNERLRSRLEAQNFSKSQSFRLPSNSNYGSNHTFQNSHSQVSNSYPKPETSSIRIKVNSNSKSASYENADVIII